MSKRSVIEIKKYANRRLYDMSQSAYITLSDLAVMVQDGKMVAITDAKTGEDLTANTLLQVLSETQQDSHLGLSAKTLARIIAYDNAITGQALGAHLDKAMAAFHDSQDASASKDEANPDLRDIKEALSRLNDAVRRYDA